jgi:hypothetical protein
VDTGTSLEGGDGGEGLEGGDGDEGWERVKRLLVLARSAPETELSPERRARIREELLDKLARIRERRLMARGFVTGASTMLLAALLLKLVSGALPWAGRGGPELASKPAVQRVVAE